MQPPASPKTLKPLRCKFGRHLWRRDPFIERFTCEWCGTERRARA